jgi:hypothetical protein
MLNKVVKNNTHEAVAEPESIVPETDQVPMEAKNNCHCTNHCPSKTFKLVKVKALLQADNKNYNARGTDAAAYQVVMTKHNGVG